MSLGSAYNSSGVGYIKIKGFFLWGGLAEEPSQTTWLVMDLKCLSYLIQAAKKDGVEDDYSLKAH